LSRCRLNRNERDRGGHRYGYPAALFAHVTSPTPQAEPSMGRLGRTSPRFGRTTATPSSDSPPLPCAPFSELDDTVPRRCAILVRIDALRGTRTVEQADEKVSTGGKLPSASACGQRSRTRDAAGVRSWPPKESDAASRVAPSMRGRPVSVRPSPRASVCAEDPAEGPRTRPRRARRQNHPASQQEGDKAGLYVTRAAGTASWPT